MLQPIFFFLVDVIWCFSSFGCVKPKIKFIQNTGFECCPTSQPADSSTCVGGSKGIMHNVRSFSTWANSPTAYLNLYRLQTYYFRAHNVIGVETKLWRDSLERHVEASLVRGEALHRWFTMALIRPNYIMTAEPVREEIRE